MVTLTSIVVLLHIDYSTVDTYILIISTFLVKMCRYNDVISASDMVDQSPVRGCMVIKVIPMYVCMYECSVSAYQYMYVCMYLCTCLINVLLT